ncbi:MAG: carboxypeptidase regulatory-like domain-containing protein [Bacteroidota bacterium]
MRTSLLALCLLTTGCGTIVPYSLAPGPVAPNVVPDQAASVLVVTDRAQIGARASVTGRVVDRETSAPVSARVTLGETALAATEAGAFATPLDAGEVTVRVTADGYAPVEAVVSLAERERATLLVLLGAR